MKRADCTVGLSQTWGSEQNKSPGDTSSNGTGNVAFLFCCFHFFKIRLFKKLMYDVRALCRPEFASDDLKSANSHQFPISQCCRQLLKRIENRSKQRLQQTSGQVLYNTDPSTTENR